MNKIEIDNDSLVASDLNDCQYTFGQIIEGQERHKNWQIPSYSSRLEAVRCVLSAMSTESPNLFTEVPMSVSAKLCALSALERIFPNAIGLSAFMTSGSSGFPKIVVHSNESLFTAANAIRDRYQIPENQNWQHLFPSFYMAGFLNCTLVPIASKGKILVDDAFSFASGLNVGRTSDKFNTDAVWLSPLMVASLTKSSNLSNFKKPKWKYAYSATGQLSTSARDDFERCSGVQLLNTYGTTEQLFISSETIKAAQVTCGIPFPHVQIVANEDHLIVNSQTSSVGILEWNSHDNVYEERATGNGNEFSIPDRGQVQDGLLSINGRADSIVVIGGQNISLNQIERIANGFAGVVEAVAVGIDGGTLRDLALYLETEESSELNLDELKSELYRNLGEASVPRKYIVLVLPRTPTGKVDRQKLIKLASQSK
jgi:acyl-coenzyme A synthetase/AMP-(fatty) acid ligase